MTTNTRHRDRSERRPRLTVVVGSDARELCASLRQPGDPVIDAEHIGRAMLGPDASAGGELPAHVRHLAIRAAVYAAHDAYRLNECTSRGVASWLIHPDASPEAIDRYRQMGYRVLVARELIPARHGGARPGGARTGAEGRDLARWHDAANVARHADERRAR